MRTLLAVLALAAIPAVAADNAAEHAANSAGKVMDKAAKGIERGAKRTAKAAERPRKATEGFLERSGRKIDKATGGR